MRNQIKYIKCVYVCVCVLVYVCVCTFRHVCAGPWRPLRMLMHTQWLDVTVTPWLWAGCCMNGLHWAIQWPHCAEASMRTFKKMSHSLKGLHWDAAQRCELWGHAVCYDSIFARKAPLPTPSPPIHLHPRDPWQDGKQYFIGIFFCLDIFVLDSLSKFFSLWWLKSTWRKNHQFHRDDIEINVLPQIHHPCGYSELAL